MGFCLSDCTAVGLAAQNLEPGSPKFHLKVPLKKSCHKGAGPPRVQLFKFRFPKVPRKVPLLKVQVPEKGQVPQGST